jgi:hypothetical protein
MSFRTSTPFGVTQSTLSAWLAVEHYPLAKSFSEALEVAKRQNGEVESFRHLLSNVCPMPESGH